MPARIDCPACHTTLAVNAANREGVVLRCPKCRHEFAVRLRQPAARPPAWPGHDPLAPPLPHAGHDTVPSQPGPARTMNTALLWIGLGASAAFAVVVAVLVVILMRLSPSPDGQQIAVAPPATESTASPPSGSGQQTPSSTAVDTPEPNGTPVNSQTTSGVPATNQTATIGSPVSSVTPASPPAGPPVLAYRFNGGEEYAYSFSIKAEAAGTTEQVHGMCSLILSRETAVPEFASHEQTAEGSGSGFVVTSDGHLVTCAHVVEGSTKIDVVLAGQSYPGQVVAFDKAHDLAVVRIIGSNLPTVPLGNSEGVELAQEVRAVGYPLSNVLGESVKITRGTLAGVVNTEGRKLFQVDASINPGNSGGPLVNEMGQVIGVASAKMAGEDIDGVGFAVPANEVLNLLKSKGIVPAVATGGEKLDGPNLARRVTPAVALLKVKIGPGGYGMAHRLLVDFSGHVSSSPARTGNVRAPGVPRVENERGKLLLSERGELIDATGNAQIPYLLGPLGQLIIEPLGAAGERTWQTQRVTVLTQVVGEESPNSLSARFRRRGRTPFVPQAKVVVTPAVETSSYELAGENGDLVTIKKRYTFQTIQAAGTPPLAQVTGEGTLTFNRASGYAEKLDYKATLVRSSRTASATIPYTLAWQRLDQQAIERTRAQALANLEAAKKAAAEQSSRGKIAPPVPPKVDDLLAELKNAKEWDQRLNPLMALERMRPVDDRRAEVTAAVEPLMNDANHSIRDRAIRIMGRWGTKQTVPALAKMLEQRDVDVRRATIEALGQIADEDAARELASLVLESSDRAAAVAALRGMGNVAETAVIRLLDRGDRQVRKEACQILGEVGGSKSAAALKQLLQNEKESQVRGAARAALDRLVKAR
ncbi:MAG TPA: trypsin-like peptidase domain-containing protein [Pirellulales bacterium]|nr:trypsin-like peptidase domain-containing protein [Pirellulales bacterium]